MPVSRSKIQGLDPKSIMEARKILPFNHLGSKMRYFFQGNPSDVDNLRVPTFIYQSLSFHENILGSLLFLTAPSLISSCFALPGDHESQPQKLTYPQKDKWPLQSCGPLPLVWLESQVWRDLRCMTITQPSKWMVGSNNSSSFSISAVDSCSIGYKDACLIAWYAISKCKRGAKR